MTDAPGKSPASVLRIELSNWCEAWETCFKKVLTQISGQATVFEVSSQSLPLTDSDVWYTVVAGGAVHGEMTLRLSAASGTRFAQKLLSETASAAPGITAEHKEALEELLRQVAGLAATAVAATVGGQVQLNLSASAAPSWSSDAVVCLQTRDQDGTFSSVEIQISPALAAELHPKMQPAAPGQTSVQPSPPSSTLPFSNYGRLMDVGLEVKLRFGTRRMRLRDVLALSAGVVVELDNSLHSPVDLLLDGRLIAQGEVVVVDGKYGLRVTNVVDRAPAAGSPG